MTDEDHCAIGNQARELEKDAFYSSKGHYRAAAVYDRVSFYLGCSIVLLSSASGLIQAFQVGEAPATFLDICSTLIAFTVAAATAVVTFAKFNDMASSHRASGVKFGTLRDEVRLFYRVGLRHIVNPDYASGCIARWIERKATLNAEATHIPAWAYAAATRERPPAEFERRQNLP